MQEARTTCREFGGKARFAAAGPTEPPFETRIDLNGDGVEDYILDYQGLSCDSAKDEFINPGMCGSAGCLIAIFISGPRGYAAVPAGTVQAWRLVRTAQPPRMRVELHGDACGRIGADTCFQEWGWNGRTFGRLGDAGTQTRTPSPGQGGPGWTQTTGRNGYRVASIIGLPSPVAGIALTCERTVPMLGMKLGRLAARTVTVAVATTGGRAEIALMPVNASGDWAAPVRDPRVLDLLGGPANEARVTIAGRATAIVPLLGARDALGAALAGCYRLAASRPMNSATGATRASTETGRSGPLADAEQFIDKVYRLMSQPPAGSWPEIYTPEFSALSQRWSDGFARSGEEGEPTDPLCDAADCGGIRLVSRSVRALPNGRAEAIVRYDFPEFQSAGPAMSQTLILERTTAGWRIADIVGETGSHIAYLRQDLARWERPRRRR